jgi:hypothetical protein
MMAKGRRKGEPEAILAGEAGRALWACSARPVGYVQHALYRRAGVSTERLAKIGGVFEG